MNKTIVEYGQSIDPHSIVEPPDAEDLVLEPGHPGLGDSWYIQRRRNIFERCRHYRLYNLGPPVIQYSGAETETWQEVFQKLEALHQQHASSIYLRAKQKLGLCAADIPQVRTLSMRVAAVTRMHLVPAEGPLPYRTFYQYIGRRGFPVTQFLRHGSHPEFTPEPDMIHDCLGHVPPLMDRDYAVLLTMIVKAASAATTGEQVLALKRFSWFSIEFGLITEERETKVFGAGILSSTDEIPFSLSKEACRMPFVTDEVIETDYDPSRMQDRLFVIPSFQFLRRELEGLIKRLGIAL